MRCRWVASLVVLLLAACTENRVGGHRCIGAWRPLFDDLDRVVLAVGGTSERDVYLVGGGLGFPGKNALVMHFDGVAWRELASGRPETIWWVHAIARDDVWMVGDDGLALHWDGASFLRVNTRTHSTLFGAWGTSHDDVWFVGGKPGAGAIEDNEVLLHWDGTRVSKEVAFRKKGRALFKVFASDEEVWVSGESGSLWNKKAGAWTDHSSEVSVLTSPFSLTGCSARELYAVGGKSVYAYDGKSWRLEDDAPVGTIAIGAACGTESLLVVGSGGMKLRYEKKTREWFEEQDEVPWDTDFHGAWIAPDGSIWAGGGNFLTTASLASRRVGVVGYRGCGDVPSTVSRIETVRVDEQVEPSEDAGAPIDGGVDGGIMEDAGTVDQDAGAEDTAVAEDAAPADDGGEPDAGFEPDATPDAGCSGAPREPLPGDLIINEFLADPAPTAPEGDANRDGIRDAVADEFVEIVNVSSTPLELVDLVVSDTVGIRHVFGPTRLGCGQAVVVFGGGDPFGASWQPNWTVASEATLGLNNTGDRIDLGIYNFGDIASVVYGSDAEIDQSMVRSTERDGAARMIPHSSAPEAAGRRFSPGFRTDGSNF